MDRKLVSAYCLQISVVSESCLDVKLLCHAHKTSIGTAGYVWHTITVRYAGHSVYEVVC